METMEPQEKESTLPAYQTWLAVRCMKLPRKTNRFLWHKLLFPFFKEIVDPTLRYWVQLSDRRGWKRVEDFLLAAAGYIPFYPIYVEVMLKAQEMLDEIMQSLRQNHSEAKAHVHVLEVNVVNLKEFKEKYDKVAE